MGMRVSCFVLCGVDAFPIAAAGSFPEYRSMSHKFWDIEMLLHSIVVGTTIVTLFYSTIFGKFTCYKASHFYSKSLNVPRFERH
jgi:hypothetical protein